MRALAFRGLAGTVALLAMGLAGSAGAAPAGSTMTTGSASGSAAGTSWGSVPDVGLRPPAATPAPPPRGSWGPGGWQSGNAPPPPSAAPGAPAFGGPAAPRSGMVTGTAGPGRLGEVRGSPDGWRDDRAARDGGWRGQGGDGPNYGSGGATWSGRYNRVGRGYVLPGYLRTPNFTVSDWRGYGLVPPAYGQTWIRYYDDALLIDGYGRVVAAQYGVDWDRTGPPPGYVDYGDGQGYEPGNYDRGFDDNGVRVTRSGPNAPEVTVHRNPDGSTVVVVKNQPGVTTTTTTYPDEVVTDERTTWTRRSPPRSRRR